MRHPILWSLSGATACIIAGLGARRYRSDRRSRAIETALLATDGAPAFAAADLEGLPEPARRWLRHAIAPGTSLTPACRLWMEGTMTPTPGGPAVALTAVETLAPRKGFVWTAKARMNGLPVRVRDHYYRDGGGIDVAAIGIVPLPIGSGPDVTRSSRGRLVAEGVWCPTALVHPDVAWESVDEERARYTLIVDGEAITVTIRVASDGALRDVVLLRWGGAEGSPARLLPYGFRVEEEHTFDGVTIPTHLTGGWQYGTDRFDPGSAATFSVSSAEFAGA